MRGRAILSENYWPGHQETLWPEYVIKLTRLVTKPPCLLTIAFIRSQRAEKLTAFWGQWSVTLTSARGSTSWQGQKPRQLTFMWISLLLYYPCFLFYTTQSIYGNSSNCTHCCQPYECWSKLTHYRSLTVPFGEFLFIPCNLRSWEKINLPVNASVEIYRRSNAITTDNDFQTKYRKDSNY